MKILLSVLTCYFLLLTACTAIPPTAANSISYYIDSISGNDTALGTSPETAWQSLDRLLSAQIHAGDTVLFKRGGEYRGQLVPVTGSVGAPTRYGAYGDGAKPVLMGSVNKSKQENWSLESGNRYQCDQKSPYDIGNIIFNHEASVGLKKWALSELNSQGDYFYDPQLQTLYLYSVGNPSSYYNDIECALNRFIINESDRSYVLIEDLDLRYGAANGIGGGNTAFVTIRNCDFSYIGGGFLYQAKDGSMIRYGNAVEFQRNAHDNLVENCRFNQIYDTAVTNQSNANPVAQYNITYRNNLIRNCGMASVEIWVRDSGSTLHDILFEHNTCYNAGGGWAAGQNRFSPFGTGHHVTSFGSDCIPERIQIRNNIFHTAVNPDVAIASAILIQPIGNQTNAQANFSFANNCYYNNGQVLAYFVPTSGSAITSFEVNNPVAYQTATKQDAQSLFVDPQLIQLSSENYKLSAGSPCRNTGMTGNSTKDIDANIRPMGIGPDMGAFEFVE